ncbi:alanine racemase [soil metagenome]
MTLRLTVDTVAWREHIEAVASEVHDSALGLVPVVKGNGYGLGRLELATVAADLADTIAVGTVHELDGLPAGPDVVVLTPTLALPELGEPSDTTDGITPERIVLTVGSHEHVEAIRGWRGRVLVKVASSMQRYGDGPELLQRARRAGLDVLGWSIHPPLAGTDQQRVAEIEQLLEHLDADIDVWLSHLSPAACVALPDTHRYRLRMGTWLWHGDKSFLRLSAEVLATRQVHAADRAGYRLVQLPGDGTLVMVGAGSAHGIAPLPDGRSPFHHRRRRLTLLEPPHMHTSMVFVPAGEPVPAVGERVDVQRPLITTHVDRVEWA